jgi:hypothetical protein
MAVYTINRLPTLVFANCNPCERLFGTFLTYHHLPIFGSDCFVLPPLHERTKLDPCSCLCCSLSLSLSLSLSPTIDIFLEPSSSEQQSYDAHQAAPLESPYSIQSEAFARTSPLDLRCIVRLLLTLFGKQRWKRSLKLYTKLYMESSLLASKKVCYQA